MSAMPHVHRPLAPRVCRLRLDEQERALDTAFRWRHGPTIKPVRVDTVERLVAEERRALRPTSEITPWETPIRVADLIPIRRRPSSSSERTS